MKRNFSRSRLCSALVKCRLMLAVALIAVSAGASAADYPTKPIKIVNPFAPGGATDTLARTIGQKLTERWGQPVVIESRPGAGGVIGTDVVAKSAPDGYTLVIVAGSHSMNASVFSKLPFDPVKDFAPVIEVVEAPFILVVHPSVRANSVAELVALARANPGKLTYASAGVGTSNHLAGDLFKTLAEVNMTHVPYKGSSLATNDLLGGQVTMIFNSTVSSMSFVKAGRLRALAFTGTKRSPLMPELPTVAEAGLPGFDVTGWYGILAPAGTPPEIVRKLNEEINRIIQLPDVQEGMRSQGFEPVGGSAETYAALIKAEIEKWAKVVKATGSRAD